MNDTRKVIQIGIGIFLLLAAIVGIYFFMTKKPGVKPIEEKAVPVSPPSAAEEGNASLSPESLVLPPVELDKSDDLLRQLARDISSHPGLSAWLKTKDLVRKYAAAVDNIANGLSPKAQIDFFAPAKDFKVMKREGKVFIDPASYDRYNSIADVFVSLDTKAAARLYLALRPLLQEAYKELGYPNDDFQDTLVRAAAEMLTTPIVEGRIAVEMKVSSYGYVDKTLEGLSQAQKQFLRMGPDNMQVIQTKLRDMALAAGIPEYRLPKPQFYTPTSAR